MQLIKMICKQCGYEWTPRVEQVRQRVPALAHRRLEF